MDLIKVVQYVLGIHTHTHLFQGRISYLYAGGFLAEFQALLLSTDEQS